MNKPEVKRPDETQGLRKKITRDEVVKTIKRMRDRDAELVSGIFKNLENPATSGSRGNLCFGYKIYPGDENIVYNLFDGERYIIPRGVARHLNNGCYYKEYKHIPGEQGQQGVRSGYDPKGRYNPLSSIQVARKVHRYAFHSLEYMDDDYDMYPADIVEVKTV